MKKTLVLICTALLASSSAFASGLKFYFGPAITTINYTGPTFWWPWQVSRHSLLQLTGGVGYELSFSSHLALELDVMYMPGGGRWDASLMGTKAKVKYKGYGFSMPLLLKGYFLKGTTPYVLAGGSLAYTMSANNVIDIEDLNFHLEQDMISDVNRVQYCLIFGVGMNIAVGSMNFVVEFRYDLGLPNLYKNPPPDQTAKASSVIILAGYKF